MVTGKGNTMSMKITIAVLLVFFSSGFALAQETEETDSKQQGIFLPLLLTWGAYEAGDDTEESQRNVKVLWGTALVVTAGVVLYQRKSSNGNTAELRLTDLSAGPSVEFNYRF